MSLTLVTHGIHHSFSFLYLWMYYLYFILGESNVIKDKESIFICQTASVAVRFVFYIIF